MPIPLNNYYVGRKLREVSSYNNSSMDLLDDAVPAIILNPSNAGVEVQPSITKPNASQTPQYAFYVLDASSRQAQVATVTATKRVFLVGFTLFNLTATACNFSVYDAVSGAAPSDPSAGTIVYGTAAKFELASVATANDFVSFVFPIPVEMTAGIRMSGGGAGVSARGVIIYYEETVNAL